MAYGLPVEGDDGPFVGEQAKPATTCEATATVGRARLLVEEAGSEPVIVVHRGLVVGDVDDTVLAGVDDDRALLDVLRPVPSTVRPSATVASLAEPEPNRVVVTTADGRLLGQAVVEPDADGDHAHHGGHDHDHEESPDLERMEHDLTEVMEAVADHFGDREPSDAELRTFLRDRLVAEGRTPEEADRFMDELNGNG